LILIRKKYARGRKIISSKLRPEDSRNVIASGGILGFEEGIRKDKSRSLIS